MSSIDAWLEMVGLQKYGSLFEENEITMDVLPLLTESDVKDLGLPLGPRRRLMVEIAKLAAATSNQSFAPPASPRASGTGGIERRQLTVMFCDLVGSTALAERLDPEELRDLMQSYREACADVVQRYEGHIAQYLGDGLMVYFGWPIAHEDDAERGVRSALDMVDAVCALEADPPLEVRIGIATGEVVVGQSARQSASEARLAVGETPNLAARLQGLAGPNEIVVAPTTRRLLGDAFELTDMGASPLKGIAEPVQTWRVDAVRRTEGRFDAAHGGDLIPLVGRDDEYDLLVRLWRRSVEGDGQIVTISGEPGIGKSRITQALRDHVQAPYVTLRYQNSPYHMNSPLHAFITHFELAAGFVRDDTTDQRLDKLEAHLIGSADEVEEIAPLFAAMLSLPTARYPPLDLSPQRQKEKTFEAIAAQIEAQAGRQPVLMVVEDMHWVDPTSQELLIDLVRRTRHNPILLLTTTRLEYEAPWTGEPAVTTMMLNRLGKRQGAQIVVEVTGGKGLPPEVLDEILARTDGVPLFVEELTKSVLESGHLEEHGDQYTLDAPLAALAIPTSLRDSLMARLDRLDEVKEIAQIGACIGREFSHEIVAGVATMSESELAAAIDRLVDARLVMRGDPPPNASYTFKHALIQDVAYESLLKKTRGELHGRIAHLLENDLSDQAENKPEWLAHHHTQAGNLSAAIPLWRRAGSLAVKRVALQEAIAYFQKGLGLVDGMPESSERNELELSIREPLNAAWTGLHGWAAPEVGVNAEAILELAEGLNNADSQLLAIWWMWTTIITQGRIADSAPWAQRLLDEGEASNDIDLQTFGHATAMVQHMLLGEPFQSREAAARAVDLYDPHSADRWLQLTGHDLRTFVEVYACQVIWMLGYPDQAVEVCHQSVEHAREEKHAFNLVWALTFSAYTFAYRREPDRFVEQVGEADRLAREQGIHFISRVSVPQARGLAMLQGGRPLEAIALLRQGIEGWTSVGGHVRVPFLKAALAEAEAREGEVETALELIDECVEQIERESCQERCWLPEVLRVRGAILEQRGDDEAAEEQLRAAVACALKQQAKSWELRSATTLARLLRKNDRGREAHDLLAPIYDWFTEGLDTPDLMEAKSLIVDLALAEGI